VPAVVVLEFVNTWLIVDPEPALAPVIGPVTVPIVHANVLAVVAVKAMFVEDPVHIVFVDAVVTTGAGFTVTVIV
jgi:hypothetical protein